MKQYKSIFNEVTVPNELVDSSMEKLDGNILEYLNSDIILLLTNGVYSKNFYKVIKALYQMNVVQGLNAKTCILFIKHFFNYLLNPDNTGIVVPSTFIAGVAWDAADREDSSFIFHKIAQKEAQDVMYRIDKEIESDLKDGVGKGWPFDPDYSTPNDYETHFGDEIIDKMEPIYVGIIPTLKGFNLTYIGRMGTEEYQNVNLKRFLSAGTMGMYNFFNSKALLTTYNKVMSSNRASFVNWLKK